MDIILYKTLFQKNGDCDNNEKNDDYEINNALNNYIIIIEVIGLIIGLYFICGCEKNIIYNLILFIFSPWLFILLHCYAKTC